MRAGIPRNLLEHAEQFAQGTQPLGQLSLPLRDAVLVVLETRFQLVAPTLHGGFALAGLLEQVLLLFPLRPEPGLTLTGFLSFRSAPLLNKLEQFLGGSGLLLAPRLERHSDQEDRYELESHLHYASSGAVTGSSRRSGAVCFLAILRPSRI